MAKTQVKRYTDKPYYAFTYHGIVHKTGIAVRCPVCNELGQVKIVGELYGENEGSIVFQCTVCGKKIEKEQRAYTYRIHEFCTQCEKHFRIDVDKAADRHFKVLNVECPYCHHRQTGTVQKIGRCIYRYDVPKGIEPSMNLPLYYQTVFDGKIIWAFNREHLVYLINYIEADLRETREQAYMDFQGTATQSDHLPKFMKLAKNRDAIVKALRRLL